MNSAQLSGPHPTFIIAGFNVCSTADTHSVTLFHLWCLWWGELPTERWLLELLKKKESVKRVSVGGELHSQPHPSLFIVDPPLQYSCHQPSSLTTQQRHAETPAVLLPSTNQTDQGLRLPISWKHSLNITACSVPERCAPKGSCCQK